jgi:hypothetical protein
VALEPRLDAVEQEIEAVLEAPPQWCAGLLAVALPLMLWRYRARTSG